MNRTLGLIYGLVPLLLLHSASVLAQEPVKCGFSEIAALHAAAAHDANALSSLQAAMARPTLPSRYVTPDGRFKIHYTTTGADAVDPVSTNPTGAPDFVYETARVAQRAYSLLVDSLGMRPAASDNGVDGPEFDFYINNRPNLEYGSTIIEFVGEGSGPAYIQIDNDYGPGYYTQGLDGLRVTVAHEYFHAVQLNYYFRTEDLYFFESSAVWFEDYAYNSINDYYAYLPRWFRDPDLPLNTRDNSHEYGSCIWLHYLTKRLGAAEVVRALWERVVSEPAVFATRHVLQSQPYNLPFDQAIQEFYNWCFFTSYRADAAKYFVEGANYPLTPFNDSNSFRVTDNASYTADLPPLAARYYRFIRSGLDLQLRLQVDAEPGRWNLTTITADVDEEYLLQTDRALATINVTAPDREDTVFVAVANVGLPPNANQTPVSRSELQIGVGNQQDLQNVLEVPRPNPVRPSRGDILKIPYRINARIAVAAFIYREDGRVIWNENFGVLPAGPHEIIWNGVNNEGDRVGSGVYFVRLIAGDFVESAKFVLLNQ